MHNRGVKSEFRRDADSYREGTVRRVRGDSERFLPNAIIGAPRVFPHAMSHF